MLDGHTKSEVLYYPYLYEDPRWVIPADKFPHCAGSYSCCDLK